MDPIDEPRRQWVGYAFVAFAAVIWAIMFARGERYPHSLVASKERRPLPALTLTRFDGGSWRLVDHRGQVVVINYWASWCSPCWEEAPLLMRLSQEMGPEELAVVGVAMDEGSPKDVAKSVRHFVETLQISYPIALSEPMSQMAYGMEGLPATLLVDRNGAVAKTYVGAVKAADLRADVQALLSETTR